MVIGGSVTVPCLITNDDDRPTVSRSPGLMGLLPATMYLSRLLSARLLWLRAATQQT